MFHWSSITINAPPSSSIKMTHRRDFKTIFEVSEWITDSTLFREYDLEVFMIKNEKTKKIESFTLTTLSSVSEPLTVY